MDFVIRPAVPPDAVYLETGNRRPDRDEVDYPDEDLRIAQLPDGRRAYVRRDGIPIRDD